MKSLFGYLFALVGGLGLAWVLVTGVSFTGVYAMGCIGTRGREACSEMGFMFGLTVVAALVCWLMFRAGRALLRTAPKAPQPAQGTQPPTSDSLQG